MKRSFYMKRSFIRRTPKESTAGTHVMSNNTTAPGQNSLERSQKRSTTITMEAVSNGGGREPTADQDTIDIHLASGEEDISESDESDSLLRFGTVNRSKPESTDGTTYL